MSTSPDVASESVVRHSWLAVSAVGMATFSVVTTEMLPVGLLTPIADTLDTSTGSAGLMISLPALLAALFAPLVVIVSGSLDRRTMLCGLLTVLLLANIASALAQNMAWMLAARVLVGFCMGGIWAIAGGLASRLVPARSVGLATSLIFGGVAAASVLGVPPGARRLPSSPFRAACCSRHCCSWLSATPASAAAWYCWYGDWPTAASRSA